MSAKRIAVVGSGIAGLTSAWLLNRRHDVHLFEKRPRLGGHTHTVRHASDGRDLPLDTGFNVLAFLDRDHMGPGEAPVREKLNRWMGANGAEEFDGRILLLTGLRHFGQVFNPVSFYFCHDADDRLTSVVAEVNNTFGETYCYLLENESKGRVVVQDAAKEFHVSPFQPVRGDYRFRVTAPEESMNEAGIADRVEIRIVDYRDVEGAFDAVGSRMYWSGWAFLHRRNHAFRGSAVCF